MEIKSFKGLVDDALNIRIEVFVKEQGFVDEEDEIDSRATHLVAYEDGKPIATCRFFKEEGGEDFVLGRLCVIREKRGAGVGARLLFEAEKGAKALGAAALKLHSQYHARAFYEKCGYKQVGKIELEQGKEHVWMKKYLKNGEKKMSKVKNEPKYKNGLLQAIRAQLEHRAFWLYLLCDEARKRGLDPRDFGSAAVKRCGLSQGADLVKKGGTDSLKGLKKTLFTKPAQLVFEMDVLESTDDKLSIDFHYCPLVKAWQNAGCSDEEIAELCDIAMCGDHGIGECYGSVLDLPKCIAKGDDVCSLRYHKKG